MSIFMRRITVSMLVTLVVVGTSMWAAGLGFARISDAQDTTAVPAMSARSVSVVQATPAPPTMADLRAVGGRMTARSAARRRLAPLHPAGTGLL